MSRRHPHRSTQQGALARRAHLLLALCALLPLSLQCDPVAKKEQVEAKAKQKVQDVKQNMSELKQKARALPDKMLTRGTRAEILLALEDEEFEQLFHEHLTEIKRYDAALGRLMTDVKARADLFPNGDRQADFKALKPEQREEIRQYYSTLLDYMRALDGLKLSWEHFHRINPLKHKERHARAFLVSYAAWLVQYKHGLEFIDAVIPNMPFETFLDEAAPRHDIPERSFADLKLQIVQVKSVSRLLGSHHYGRAQRKALEDEACTNDELCYWAVSLTRDYHDVAHAQLKERSAVQFSYNAYDIVRDMAFASWFPVQKSVAEWMGDTKVKRLHQHLITGEQIATMREKMRPGDIIVARKNWYLSNIGLPGFWPHAELYLGAPERLDDYFSDAALGEHIPELSGEPKLSVYLSRTYPDAWKAYLAKPDHEGEAHEVIESMSEGVLFSSLERAAGADYVGVLRPRREKLEQARAIIKAFRYWGRPYDFNFDFLTDSTIVCTELVYKAWE